MESYEEKRKQRSTKHQRSSREGVYQGEKYYKEKAGLRGTVT